VILLGSYVACTFTSLLESLAQWLHKKSIDYKHQEIIALIFSLEDQNTVRPQKNQDLCFHLCLQ
jgi:hypothetical protein